MVSVLGNAVLAFLESGQGGTLLDLRNFLVDSAFRAEILKTVRDDEVISYWQREFTLLKGVPHAPVLTRLNTFLRPKLIRRMVAQKANRLDFRGLMDEKKIVLAKLSHGAIGEENAHLLGSLLVAKIAQAAMSRQNVAAEKREPYICYIDEFHHFVTPSIASILSGARKYGLGLVLAHQEMRQLRARSEEVASAVLANAGTRVVFRVGEQDAKALAEGFSSFDAKDLQSLGVGEAIARVERADFDFNLRTQRLEPVEPDIAASRRTKVISASRAAYATPRSVVDAQIAHSADEARSSGSTSQGEQRPKRPRGQRIGDQGEGPDRPGRGGAQHKYLQDLVRRLAIDRGFDVSLEKTVLDGYGFVDAVLTGHNITVACEISVTTTIEHEVGNLTKCLASGFDHVLFISSDDRNRDLARAEMARVDAARIHICTPGEVAALLDRFATAAPKRARTKNRGQDDTPTSTQVGDNVVLTTEQAARYVGLAKQTLAEMRVKGNGPPFYKSGRRVVYKPSDLDAWLAARRRRSTSDEPREIR
jgi:excisionase family DNA binding protein